MNDLWERAADVICIADLALVTGIERNEFLAELRRRYPTETALRAMLDRVTEQLPEMRKAFFDAPP